MSFEPYRINFMRDFVWPAQVTGKASQIWLRYFQIELSEAFIVLGRAGTSATASVGLHRPAAVPPSTPQCPSRQRHRVPCLARAAVRPSASGFRGRTRAHRADSRASPPSSARYCRSPEHPAPSRSDFRGHVDKSLNIVSSHIPSICTTEPETGIPEARVHLLLSESGYQKGNIPSRPSACAPHGAWRHFQRAV